MNDHEAKLLLAQEGLIAGEEGGFWCMTCRVFIPRGELIGKIFRLATHKVGRAIHSVRFIRPLEAPPER